MSHRQLDRAIEGYNTGHAEVPQGAMDGSGNATVVWRQFDGTRGNVWSNRYVAATNSWGTAELIETNDGQGPEGGADVAVDGNGNAVAVWRQYDGTRDNIWTNCYVVGTGWGTVQVIELANGDAAGPQVAIDGNGNAIAVWRQDDGTRLNILASRYVAATNSWGTAELIETNDGQGPEGGADVAVDGNGNAVVVWQQENGTRLDNWANQYR